MGLIVVPGYQPPQPNPELEKKVVKELREMTGERLLGMLWVPRIVWNQAQEAWEGRYALVCKYPENDPRRKAFQEGETDIDYEILGWFCKDMQNAESMPVEPDAIWNRVLELLAKADNTKLDWKVRLKQVAEKNAKAREQRKQDFLNGVVHDHAEYYRNKYLGVTQVNVTKDIK